MAKRPFALELVTGPAAEPVGFEEAKLHIKSEADENADDTLIQRMIAAAREWAEDYTNRALMTQTWRYKTDYFPYYGDGCPDGFAIRLPKPPLQAVSSIKYYDTNGALQTLPAPDYIVDKASEPGFIFPAVDKSWPSTQSGRPHAVEVEFVCGYADLTAVPNKIALGLMMYLMHFYRHRGDENVPPCEAAERLCYPLRIFNV